MQIKPFGIDSQYTSEEIKFYYKETQNSNNLLSHSLTVFLILTLFQKHSNMGKTWCPLIQFALFAPGKGRPGQLNQLFYIQ